MDAGDMEAALKGELDLNKLATEIHENAMEHGWWPDERSDEEVLSLVHSEWSEALEAYRNSEPLVWTECAIDGERCRQCACQQYDAKNQVCAMGKPTAKPEGVAVELIDGCIRLLDAAVVWAILPFPERKAYSDNDVFIIENESVPELIMDLHKMTSELWDTDDIDRDWPVYEIVNKVFIWLRRKGINPEAVMIDKHLYNRTRPYRHGGKKI